MKRKQHHPGFEFESSISVPATITVTLNVLRIISVNKQSFISVEMFADGHNYILWYVVLWKFLVESVLGHLQGGNYEFKIAVWTNTEKYSKKITLWKVNFKQVKGKHSIYKKSVCIRGERKKERKKEERVKRGNIVDRWSQVGSR